MIWFQRKKNEKNRVVFNYHVAQNRKIPFLFELETVINMREREHTDEEKKKQEEKRNRVPGGENKNNNNKK